MLTTFDAFFPSILQRSRDKNSQLLFQLLRSIRCKLYFFSFLPARRYASAGYRDRNVSVCPSVRPSVTRRYCIKTKKASGMISSPSDSPTTLVFRRQISSPNSKGFPRNGGLKQGSVGKIQRFLPTRRYASAGNRDRNVSVCLSVRLPVRHAPVLCFCVKTKKTSVMISSPSGSPMILVFWRQTSWQNSKASPPTGLQRRVWWENSAIFHL